MPGSGGGRAGPRPSAGGGGGATARCGRAMLALVAPKGPKGHGSTEGTTDGFQCGSTPDAVCRRRDGAVRTYSQPLQLLAQRSLGSRQRVGRNKLAPARRLPPL
jgi:hypothetical protein